MNKFSSKASSLSAIAALIVMGAGVARADWAEHMMQPTPPVVTIRQAIASYTSSPNPDNPTDAGSFQRSFDYVSVNGSLAPAQADFTLTPNVTCPMHSDVTYASGPGGTTTAFGINGDVRSSGFNYNYYIGQAEYFPPADLSFAIIKNFNVTKDPADPTKGSVLATFNLTITNTAAFQTSHGYNGNTGQRYPYVLATATSGESTTTLGSIAPSN